MQPGAVRAAQSDDPCVLLLATELLNYTGGYWWRLQGHGTCSVPLHTGGLYSGSCNSEQLLMLTD
eukprot:7921909-Pyramimonas_sp.AAC.1